MCIGANSFYRCHCYTRVNLFLRKYKYHFSQKPETNIESAYLPYQKCICLEIEKLRSAPHIRLTLLPMCTKNLSNCRKIKIFIAVVVDVVDATADRHECSVIGEVRG